MTGGKIQIIGNDVYVPDGWGPPALENRLRVAAKRNPKLAALLLEAADRIENFSEE